jgi:hypothetical protein
MHSALFTLNKGSLLLSIALSLMLLVAATEEAVSAEDKTVTALHGAAQREA